MVIQSTNKNKTDELKNSGPAEFHHLTNTIPEFQPPDYFAGTGLEYQIDNYKYLTPQIIDVYEQTILPAQNAATAAGSTAANSWLNHGNIGTSVDSNGSTIYDIPITCTFNVPIDTYKGTSGTTTAHLSYFAMAYLDIQSILEATDLAFYSDIFIPEEGGFGFADKPIAGAVTGDMIIDNGKVVSEGTVFFDANNNIYKGEILKVINGPFVKAPLPQGVGPNELSAQQLATIGLTPQQVPLYKVQDFRTYDNLANTDFDYSGVAESFLNTGIPLISQLKPSKPQTSTFSGKGEGYEAIMKKKKESYFSTLFMTGDIETKCRFVFGLNYIKFLKDNSAFPDLYQTVIDAAGYQSAAHKDLIGLARITNFKIKRRRVSGYMPNELGAVHDALPFDKNEIEQIIVMSSDDDNGVMTATSYTAPGSGGITGEIRQASLDLPLMPAEYKAATYDDDYEFLGPVHAPIRHYAITDHQVKDKPDGIYQYGIEFEVRDPTVEYMNSLIEYLDELIHGSENKAGLEEYMELANRYGKFDTALNRFGPWLEAIMLNAGKNLPEKWDNFDGNVGEFVYILCLLTGQSVNEQEFAGSPLEQFQNSLYNMGSPMSGTPDGIELILRMMQQVRTKLQSMVDSVATSKHYKAPGSIGSTNQTIKSGGSRKAIKFLNMDYYFNSNVFDAHRDAGTGYDYLFMTDSTGDIASQTPQKAGPAVITKNYLEDRCQYETEKYWGTQSPSVNIAFGSDADPLAVYTIDDTYENQLYTFLAPSIINVATSDTLIMNMANTNNDLIMTKTLIDIIRYNRPYEHNDTAITGFNDNLSMPEEKQLLRKSLISELASRNATVSFPDSGDYPVIGKYNKPDLSPTDYLAAAAFGPITSVFGGNTSNPLMQVETQVLGNNDYGDIELSVDPSESNIDYNTLMSAITIWNSTDIGALDILNYNMHPGPFQDPPHPVDRHRVFIKLKS